MKGNLLHRPVGCDKRILVFCNTKREVDWLDRCLIKQGFKSASIHGDRSQARRNHSVTHFRDGKVNILVATSVCCLYFMLIVFQKQLSEVIQCNCCRRL